jgi:hypothetical protein
VSAVYTGTLVNTVLCCGVFVAYGLTESDVKQSPFHKCTVKTPTPYGLRKFRLYLTTKPKIGGQKCSRK